MEDNLPRKLAAVFYADVAGYSRLTGEDEDTTHRYLSEYLDLIADNVKNHRGQVMHYAGDAVLAKFEAVVDAVSSATDVQEQLRGRNTDLSDQRKVQFRIGVNLGDVIEDRGDIYGDGVNIAARLESIANPGGVCVSASVFEQIKGKLDLQFEDMGEQEFKNIAEKIRAYRVIRIPTQLSPETFKALTGEHLELPDKPSIAVLPFQNMSGDPEQEYFSDGITEDIITQLSRFTVLFVIARQSSFAFKGEKVDIKKIGQHLGVQFVVEGSVRKAGNRVRITAQLIEAETGNHIWADRYDRKLEDIFAVQDELTEIIAATVGGRITANGWQRVRVPRTNFKAYELVLQGQALHFRVLKEANSQAQEVLARALELDPDNVRAHMMLGAVHLLDFTEKWSEAPESSLEQALHHGKRSVQLDELDGQAHAHFGETLVNLGRLDEARVHYERAITLNPVDIVSRALYSLYFLRIGRANEALEQLSMVARLDPFELSWIPWFRGMAFYHLHRYEESVENLLRGSEPITDIHRWLAASYAQIDKKQEAAEHLKHYLQVAKTERPFFPGWAFEAWKPIWTKEFSYQPYSDHFCEGLEKAWACLPDTSLTVLKND